jgi:O-antigen/teichoic acid export membrane protein
MDEIKKSYTFNYIKIYFWQFLAVLLNIGSMFVVMPKLTLNPKIYGIYCVCISVSIFIGYADFGFIAAGIKYASEYFAQKKRNEETKVIAFCCFILFCFLILFSIVLFVFSYNPSLIIKNITLVDKKIASTLLLILAIFTPTFVFQKILIMIFTVRLEDYIFARITIIANIMKIISVFYFFNFALIFENT